MVFTQNTGKSLLNETLIGIKSKKVIYRQIIKKREQLSPLLKSYIFV